VDLVTPERMLLPLEKVDGQVKVGVGLPNKEGMEKLLETQSLEIGII
jgi:hypothetical protein